MWRRWLAAVIWACASESFAHAADLAQTGPQATAAQIVAARGSLSASVLQLNFAVSGGSYGAPTIMSVDLAPDYIFVRAQTSSVLYDYRLRRIFPLDESQHQFGNSSLYAIVDFRMAETYNRRYERGMLASIKVQGAAELLDPFWVQSELHVMDPADPSPAADLQTSSDGVRFSYKSAEVASFSLSDEKLGADEKAAFAHLLQEKTTLHPSIIAALLASGRVPQRLSFAPPPQRKQSAEVWILRSVSRMTAPYPLTANYTAEPLIKSGAKGASSALAETLPLMLEAVAGRAGNGPRSAAQYRALIDDAIQKKAWLQAVLTGLEVNEQYGQFPNCSGGATSCASLKDIMSQSQSDPRVGDLIRSFGIERTDPTQAIKLRQNLRRDDITNGYVVDGFIGNTLGATGHVDQALPLLIDEVRGDPYVAGYYKDLGDLFRRSFEPNLAWLCYDLGRAVPGGASAPVISTMTDYETQLASKLPQFF